VSGGGEAKGIGNVVLQPFISLLEESHVELLAKVRRPMVCEAAKTQSRRPGEPRWMGGKVSRPYRTRRSSGNSYWS